VIATDVRYPTEQIFKPQKEKPMTSLTVTTRALKVTAALDAAAVAALSAPDGQARSKLTINCEEKNYTADIATKSLRKVKATIAANGVENVFVMAQGKFAFTAVPTAHRVPSGEDASLAKAMHCPVSMSE
jgi:hypothetical protein